MLFFQYLNLLISVAIVLMLTWRNRLEEKQATLFYYHLSDLWRVMGDYRKASYFHNLFAKRWKDDRDNRVAMQSSAIAAAIIKKQEEKCG